MCVCVCVVVVVNQHSIIHMRQETMAGQLDISKLTRNSSNSLENTTSNTRSSQFLLLNFFLIVNNFIGKIFWDIYLSLKVKKETKNGPVRDLNPGPLAPKARIIPLDQLAISD